MTTDNKTIIEQIAKGANSKTEVSLEFRKGESAKQIIGYYEINGRTFLRSTGYLKGEFWRHGTTIIFSNYVDGTIIETKENSWKNEYIYHYIIHNGKAYYAEVDEFLPLLKRHPFEIELKILEDGTHEYYFEFNLIIKEYLKSQLARWNPDKKCWYSPTALKLPDGDIVVENKT